MPPKREKRRTTPPSVFSSYPTAGEKSRSTSNNRRIDDGDDKPERKRRAPSPPPPRPTIAPAAEVEPKAAPRPDATVPDEVAPAHHSPPPIIASSTNHQTWQETWENQAQRRHHIAVRDAVPIRVEQLFDNPSPVYVFVHPPKDRAAVKLHLISLAETRIRSIKKEIQYTVDIHPDDQDLWSGVVLLEDDKTLGHYPFIKIGHTLRLAKAVPPRCGLGK